MSFKIGNREFRTRVLEGRIFVNGVPYKSLVDEESGEILLSDQVPLPEQLELVATSVIALCHREQRPPRLARVVTVAHAD